MLSKVHDLLRKVLPSAKQIEIMRLRQAAVRMKTFDHRVAAEMMAAADREEREMEEAHK